MRWKRSNPARWCITNSWRLCSRDRHVRRRPCANCAWTRTGAGARAGSRGGSSACRGGRCVSKWGAPCISISRPWLLMMRIRGRPRSLVVVLARNVGRTGLCSRIRRRGSALTVWARFWGVGVAASVLRVRMADRCMGMGVGVGVGVGMGMRMGWRLYVGSAGRQRVRVMSVHTTGIVGRVDVGMTRLGGGVRRAGVGRCRGRGIGLADIGHTGVFRYGVGKGVWVTWPGIRMGGRYPCVPVEGDGDGEQKRVKARTCRMGDDPVWEP